VVGWGLFQAHSWGVLWCLKILFSPKPFIWMASARDILEKVMRAKLKLKTIQTA
jgi:hypothetical protein